MFRNMDRKTLGIIVAGLIAALLLGIGIGSYFLFGSGNISPSGPVTITFNSTGGSIVESRTIPQGEKLTEVAAPSRPGFMFAGWYYEEGPINAYRVEDVFAADTMLYAAWVEPTMEADIREYIRDCDPDMTFTVRSDVSLTQDNLSQYFRFSCVESENGPTLSVRPEGDGYLLYSEESLTPGYTYVLERLDLKTVFFEKAGDVAVADPGITAYTFNVFKENVNHVVKKAEPELLSSDDVASIEIAGVVVNGQTGDAQDDGKNISRAFLIPAAGDYEVGDIISLGNGETDAAENQYYRVINTGENGTGRYLDLILPNIEEIYSELEIYYSGDAVHFEEEENAEETSALEEEMELSLLNSEGYDYLCTGIATGIKGSPSVRSALSKMSIADQKRFEQLSIDDLADMLQNVEVEVSIQKTYDSNWVENGVRGVVKFSTGDINIPLDENFNLTLNLTLTNDITETAYGYISLQENFKANIYKGATIKNHCNLDFEAVIGTGDGEQQLNITEEIQNLVNSASSDKTQEIVNSMNKDNFFGSDLDYVEIFNKELGNKTVAIYEILSIQFKLNFHVDIGMRVGLNLNFDSTEVRTIGLNNLEGNGIKTINERLYSNTHFTAILKGQIGIRAGFRAEINFSLVHLNDYLNFGFTVDVGVYEEITGFARFDYDTGKGFSMAGGIKSETGIYLAIEFSWNLFGWQDRLTIAEFKFPILTIGALEFASEFAEAKTAVTFNTNSYNVKGGDLLKLKYVDITGGDGGVKINIKPAALSGDYALYLIKDQTGKGTSEDLKHIIFDKETGMIDIAENAPDRLDFTIIVQYTKGSSLFSDGFKPITKTINMTYMKYKVDDSSVKYTATFGWPDGRVIEQKEYYVGQIPVPPSERLYEMDAFTGPLKLLTWARPWEEDITAIYGDTEYHLDCVPNTRDISFYGSEYDASTGKSSAGLIAMIPSLYGDMPTVPALTDMSIEPGWEFYEWSPALLRVTSDYSYSAMYAQSSDYCRVNFYADGKYISGGYVKKGETPIPPDMSAYGDSSQGSWTWWPSFGPVTTNSQGYFAYFKKYVSVKFEDRDGHVISEQKILPGKTPEAPAIELVDEGEEDYFEYRFSHFETEAGVKIGPVYEDTVFLPRYVKNYFEVTTIFDAGEHTFSDGTKRKEFKGTYTPYNYLYLPQVSYKYEGKSYVVDYWQSTEKVNGSYVKLYMKDAFAYYKYDLTFEPFFKAGVPIQYKVRFFYEGKTLELTGKYGDLITQDMLGEIRKEPTDANYYYVVSSYGLTLPYRFGSSLGPDGQAYEDLGVAVRFVAVGVDKTITFDANGGTFGDGQAKKTVTAPYGTTISFVNEPEKLADLYNTYEFDGWADSAGADTGMDYDTFLVNGDRTLYAVYSETPKEYTITFNAGDGQFAGAASQIVQTYHYGAPIVPPAAPTRDADATYRYEFTGWQPAISGDATVTGNASYTAEYRAIPIYTITFDAGDGHFSDDSPTIAQTYDYGDPIVPPTDPTRDADATFRYVFLDWAPDLPYNTTVSGNATYTAEYRAIRIDGTFDETGIIVTDGTTYEDICVNGISGYTYAFDDANLIYTLTITGNGLTFSGTGEDIRVVIGAGVTEVTFDNLSISGEYASMDGLLVTVDASTRLEIRVSGTCSLINTLGDDGARFERPVQLTGIGSGASLTFGGGIYCAGDFDVTSLELEINSNNSGIENDDGDGEVWTFANSVIRLTTGNYIISTMHSITIENTSFTATGNSGIYCADMVIAGASIVNVTVSGETAVAMGAGNLEFSDFTGSVQARSIHSTAPGTAVIATNANGIRFTESGTEVGPGGYNLGGAEVSVFEAGSYESFGIWVEGTLVPATSVMVSKY